MIDEGIAEGDGANVNRAVPLPKSQFTSDRAGSYVSVVRTDSEITDCIEATIAMQKLTSCG